MLSAHHTIKAPGRPIKNFVQNQNVLHHFAYQNKRGEILESSYPIIITSPGATGVDFFERFTLSSKALLGEVIPLSVIKRPRKLRKSSTFALKKGTSIATRPLVLNILQQQKLPRHSSPRSIPTFLCNHGFYLANRSQDRPIYLDPTYHGFGGKCNCRSIRRQ